MVIGIDMTEEMLSKSRATAAATGHSNIEFRERFLEDMSVEDGWADVVISNGVINLCADKKQVFSEIMRVLRPGGYLQYADIANGKPVPEEAVRDIDLWTAWIAGGLPCAGWRKMLEESGFTDIEIGAPCDTFGGAGGETKARAFEVFGYPYFTRKPR